MIKFYYLSKDEYANKTKEADSLYFVEGVGLYKGTSLVADNGASTSAKIVDILDTLNQAIKQNQTDIATNKKNIESNDSDISSLQGTVANQGSSITSLNNNLNNKVNRLEQAISDAVSGASETLTAKIDANTTKINNNAANIDLNVDAIDKLKKQVATKAESSTVTSLQSTVNSNSSKIEDNATKITDLTGVVEGHTTSLESHSENLSTLNDGLAEEIQARKDGDSSLQSLISANTTKISTNTTNIGKNTDSITTINNTLTTKANTSTLNSKVSELNTAIGKKANQTALDTTNSNLSTLSTTHAQDIDRLETELGKKAVASTVTSQLALKADKTTTDSLQTQVKKNTNKISKLSSETDLALDGLDKRIKSNTSAIETLNGDEDTDGSVKQQVNEAVVTLVGGAPEAMNSLQKMIEWLGGYGDNEAEVMMSNLVHQVNIHDTQIGTLDGSLATETSVRQSEDARLDGRIDELSEELGATNQTIAGVAADLSSEASTREGKDNELKALIEGNAGSISANASKITTIENATIPALSSRVDANATQIESHTTLINKNKEDIATNSSNIAENIKNIATNTANIGANAANIAKNTEAISAEGAARIQADNDLDKKIADLTAEHKADVQSLLGQLAEEIEAREQGDQNVVDYVDGVKAALDDVDASLQQQINDNKNNISINATAIEALQDEVVTLKSSIEDISDKVNFIWNNFIIGTAISDANTQALKLGNAILQFNTSDESVDVTFG